MREDSAGKGAWGSDLAHRCQLLRALAPRAVRQHLYPPEERATDGSVGYGSLSEAGLHPERTSRWLAGYSVVREPPQCLVSGRGYRPFVCFGVLLLAANITVAGVSGVLWQHGKPAVVEVFEREPSSAAVVTHLLGDPVGAVVILVCCFAPILFAVQVDAVRAMLPANRRNAQLITSPETGRAVLDHVHAANGWFERFGSPTWSLACLIGACLIAAGSLWHFGRSGIYDSQLIHLVLPVIQPRRAPTHLGRGSLAGGGHVQLQTGMVTLKTAQPVTRGMLYYNHWWAAWPSHRVDTVVLGITIVYMVYYVLKGLLVGSTFFRYSYKTFGSNFPVTAYPFVNFDGYSGLRELRILLVWTYVATMLNLALFFAIFVVATWLSPYVIVGGAVVSVVPVLLVYLPTWLAKVGLSRSAQVWVAFVSGSWSERSTARPSAFDTGDRRYVTNLESGRGQHVADLATEVWSRSVLPFHPVSVVSGIFLQVVVPLAAVLLPIVL